MSECVTDRDTDNCRRKTVKCDSEINVAESSRRIFHFHFCIMFVYIMVYEERVKINKNERKMGQRSIFFFFLYFSSLLLL